MDLIEYANKFIELDTLIKAIYGSTEKGIYIDNWGFEDWRPMAHDIHVYIPNWFGWRTGIYKPSGNSKGYALSVVETMEIGDKDIFFGFWERNANNKYIVHGLDRS